jgi:predicted nucleic acid-binding protein
MLLDSNIIIYAAQPDHGELRRFIAEHSPAVSAVSLVEVLGYHKLTEADRVALESFFAAATLLPITDDVLANAVRLRQSRKMTLGDSLIAGTALGFSRTLVTRNVDDFVWISGLQLHNPFREN